jgi:anti-sigma B factor antagonist
VTRPHLSVRAERIDRRTVVAASGEVDMATAPDLEAVIAAELSDGRIETLVIDLLDVSFMDSSGLAVLVAAHQANPTLTIRLVVGPGMLEDLLRTTALDRMFTLVPSVSDAAP